MRDNQLKMPYVRMPSDLLERLNKEAQRRALIPTRTERGQNAIKVGVLELLYQLIEQAERESTSVDKRYLQEEA